MHANREELRARYRAGDADGVARLALLLAEIEPREVVHCGPTYSVHAEEAGGRGSYRVARGEFEHAILWAEIWRRISTAEERVDAIQPLHMLVAWVAAALTAGHTPHEVVSLLCSTPPWREDPRGVAMAGFHVRAQSGGTVIVNGPLRSTREQSSSGPWPAIPGLPIGPGSAIWDALTRWSTSP